MHDKVTCILSWEEHMIWRLWVKGLVGLIAVDASPEMRGLLCSGAEKRNMSFPLVYNELFCNEKHAFTVSFCSTLASSLHVADGLFHSSPREL